MTDKPAARPAETQELLRAQDRVSFLYLEHSVIHRDANAITSTDNRGTIHIPAATLGALLLGPGTSISHQAITLLAESGSTAVWVGEHSVRYYAHGRPLARSSRLLEAQARLVSTRQGRLSVARAMYSMRFPGEDTSALTMQQLRGREGARVRRAYRENSDRAGVPWRTREYTPGQFDQSDRVNQALSAATAALYGAAHAVIVALGCSPGLGFVHTGHDRSFVYDIADLYKAELAIPTAFDVAALDVEDVGAYTRRQVRDEIHASHLLERCAKDIHTLLQIDNEGDEAPNLDIVGLWDGGVHVVEAGHNYEDVDW